jgi:hypothetical protein
MKEDGEKPEGREKEQMEEEEREELTLASLNVPPLFYARRIDNFYLILK